MKKITFIFDLDGTLIDPSKYEVSQSTIHAVKKLKDDGYHIGNNSVGCKSQCIFGANFNTVKRTDAFRCGV